MLNSHLLIHLVDGVNFLKYNLSLVTAFPFENFLGLIQNYLRTSFRRLAQLCRRFHAKISLRNEKVKLPPAVNIIKVARNGRIKEIKYKQFVIRTL